MEEVLHHHHHHHPHHHPYQADINGRLGKNNLISSSMASMASLAAAVGSTTAPPPPPPPPPSVSAPSSSNVSVTSSGQQPSHLCAGCGHSIKDRYLLQALDSYWHEDCLKCSCCGCRLGEVGSNLFTKANLILCKRDYLRLFGATGSCAACCKPIPAFEMVMRAKSNVYHLDCFACQQCHQRFCVGDRFYLCDNQILCEYDYEERLIFANLAGSSHPAQFNSRGAPPPPPPPPQPPASQSHPSQQSQALTENGNGPYGRNGEASGGDVVRSQQQRVWNGPSSSPPSTSAEPAVPESSIPPPPPPPAAPVAAVKQQQDSPGAVEHDASSSGYGSPDSGGLIDEG